MHAVAGYLLEELLGEGGSGQVWRARARRTGAAVAIKLVPARGDEARAAAFAEAALLRTLDHPHLVRLHEIVPAGDRLALVIDLAGAGSLATLLAARGRLTPGEVVTALAPIGAALAHAHAGGVVHGDVTPGNIVFTPEGFPLLTDLGLARLLGQVASGRCTPAYAEPAVAAGDVPIAASDVFSLSAVAFHALTAATIWGEGGPRQLLALAAAGRSCDVPGALAASGVPAEVAAVVEAGLSLDPGRRPTAAEFALDLRCSTQPIAVELDAGRAFRTGVRPEAAFTEGVRLPEPHLRGSRGRGMRRGRDGDGGGNRGRHRAPGPGRGAREAAHRWWRPAAAAAAAGAALAGGWLLVPGGASAPAAAPSAPTPAAAAAAVDAAAVLTRIDARREQAFAAGDPQGLDEVYEPGELRQADAQTMRRGIPAGCVLVGVRNDYRHLRVSEDCARLVVRAEVELLPSRLRCGDSAAGSTDEPVPGSPGAAMVLTLVRAGPDYRIASISPDPVPARSGPPRAGP